MIALMTGATGFLGKYIVEEIIDDLDLLYIVVRSKSLQKANALFSKYNNIRILIGDTTSPDIIHDLDDFNKVIDKVDTIIHNSAVYDLQCSYKDAYMANVIGTQNMLHFASQCNSLKKFIYTSTVAVSGSYRGKFKEDTLNLNQSFTNHYAKTKFDAEKIVKDWNLNAQKIVMRPGIIIGDSESGYFEKIDGPYYFINFLKKLIKIPAIENLLFMPIPVNLSSYFPIVPVNHVAKAYKKIISSHIYGDRTYHLVSHDAPKFSKFIKDLFKIFNLKAKLIPVPKLKINSFLMDKIHLPSELQEYTYSKCKYDMKNTYEDIPEFKHSLYEHYKHNIFDYALKNEREAI